MAAVSSFLPAPAGRVLLRTPRGVPLRSSPSSPVLFLLVLVAAVASAAFPFPVVVVVAEKAGLGECGSGSPLHRAAAGDGGSGSASAAATAPPPRLDGDRTRRPARGKLLPDDFDGGDLLRAYREIRSEYRRRAFGGEEEDGSGPPPAWTVLTTLTPPPSRLGGTAGQRSDGDHDSDPAGETITVSMMEHPSDPLCPYVKMEAVLPVPVRDCWDFLLLDRWDETMPRMDPFYEGVDIFGEYRVDAGGGGEEAAAAATAAVGDDVGTKGRQPTQPQQRRRQRSWPFLPRAGQKRRSAPDLPAPSVPSSLGAAGRDYDGGPGSSDGFGYGDGDGDGDAKAIGAAGGGGIHMILARKRTKRILAFGKREFVFVSVKDEPLEDGTWVSGTVSVDAPGRVPRSPRYTRAFQDSIAFYRPLLLPATPGGSGSGSSSRQKRHGTHLTIVCRIDLNDSSEDGAGGWIPMWLYVKTIGATGARSVLNMRRALLEDLGRPAGRS